MKKQILSCLAVALLLAGCAEAPVTGRKQLKLVSDSELNAMALQQYNQFLSENKKVTGTSQAQMVQNAGTRIQRAAEEYFRQRNQSNVLSGYRWEYNLVDDPQINAWCMPGGKVVVYTGIMPVAQTETGLAVVMGHEIAHAIASHGNERMSQGLMQQLGGVALSVALSTKSQQTQSLFNSLYGVGSTVGYVLPNSRNQESEADEIGLTFMAMAGYNPNESVAFWQRMAAANKGGAPPQFLSTHPSPQTRVANLKKLIPKVMPYYNSSTNKQ